MGDDLSVMIALARHYLPGEDPEELDVLATALMLDEWQFRRFKTAVNNAVAGLFKGSQN